MPGHRPSQKYTCGLRRGTILASLSNAALLLVALGMIIWETLHRLAQPAPVGGSTVIWVVPPGIVVNGVVSGRRDAEP